jgi:ATP-dependent RNA helicase RhlE
MGLGCSPPSGTGLSWGASIPRFPCTFGAAGIALSFCNAEEVGLLKDIENPTRSPLSMVEDHDFHSASIAALHKNGGAASFGKTPGGQRGRTPGGQPGKSARPQSYRAPRPTKQRMGRPGRERREWRTG